MAEKREVNEPATWSEFIADHPNFPDILWGWITVAQNLIRRTPICEGDDLGFLIQGFIAASIVDVNDIMTLTHANSRSGAPKILRSVYERTVTMKYLAANPSEVPQFIGYQSIDWQQVLKECEARVGSGMSERSRSNLAKAAQEARHEYRGEVCPQCGLRKQTDWTPKSVKERAELTRLAHMHFFGFIFPSKLMHTTFYGTMEFMKSAAPIYNILNIAHELLVHNIA